MKLTRLLVPAVFLGLAIPAAQTSSPGRNGLIAFVAERVNGAPGIVSIGLDGHGRRNLTRHADVDPAPSPDGRRVAFTRSSEDPSGISVMNADGTGLRRLVDGRHPSWSPDGKRVGYEWAGEIDAVNVTTPTPTRSTPWP